MLVYDSESLFTKPVFLPKKDSRVAQVFYDMARFFQQHKLLPLENVLRLRYKDFKQGLSLTFTEFLFELYRLHLAHEDMIVNQKVIWNTIIGRHEYVNVYEYQVQFSTAEWRKLFSVLLDYEKSRTHESARGRHGLSKYLRQKEPFLATLAEGEVHGVVQYLLFNKFIFFSMNTFLVMKYKFLEMIEPGLKLPLDVKTFLFKNKWVVIGYYSIGHKKISKQEMRFVEKLLGHDMNLSANFVKLIHSDRSKHRAEDHVYCTLYNKAYLLRKLKAQRQLLNFFLFSQND